MLYALFMPKKIIPNLLEISQLEKNSIYFPLVYIQENE
jgi:hypothetical protein